jgi:hypothetical protein
MATIMFPTDTIWESQKSYAKGAWITPTVLNNYFYEALNAGTSAVGQPGWTTTPGNLTYDGAGSTIIVWICRQYPEEYDVAEYTPEWPMNAIEFERRYGLFLSYGFKRRGWKAKFLLLDGNIPYLLDFYDNRKGGVEKFNLYIPLLSSLISVRFAKDWKPVFKNMVQGDYSALEAEIPFEDAP